MSTNGYSRLTPSSGQLKASVVVIVAAFISQCVGLSTSYWMRVSSSPGFEIRSGLWSHCACFSATPPYGSSKSNNCFCISLSESVIDGWLTAVRALEVVGLITVFVLGVTLFAQLCCTKNRSFKVWGILLSTCAGLCILTGVTLYGIRQIHFLNFSFWFCAVSGILCLLSSILLVSDRKVAFRSQGQTQNGHVISNQGFVISQPDQQPAIEHLPNNAHAQLGLPPPYTTLPRSGSNSQTAVYGDPPPYSEVQDKT